MPKCQCLLLVVSFSGSYRRKAAKPPHNGSDLPCRAVLFYFYKPNAFGSYDHRSHCSSGHSIPIAHNSFHRRTPRLFFVLCIWQSRHCSGLMVGRIPATTYPLWCHSGSMERPMFMRCMEWSFINHQLQCCFLGKDWDWWSLPSVQPRQLDVVPGLRPKFVRHLYYHRIGAYFLGFYFRLGDKALP